MKTKIAIFEKDENFGTLGIIFGDDATMMNSYDSRTKQITRSVAEYGAPEARSFESQVKRTEENGWKVLFNGASPTYDQIRLN